MPHESLAGVLERLWQLEAGIGLDTARKAAGMGVSLILGAEKFAHLSARDAAALLGELRATMLHLKSQGAPAVAEGAIDVVATEDQRRAREATDSTNDAIKRLGGDVERGIKAKKILANTRESLGYRWMRFEGDWYAHYAAVGTTGIGPFNSDLVYKEAIEWREKAEVFRAEISKATGGDVTPGPPAPPKPDPPGSGPDWAGALKVVAIAFGIWAVSSAVKGVTR